MAVQMAVLLVQQTAASKAGSSVPMKVVLLDVLSAALREGQTAVRKAVLLVQQTAGLWAV